MSTEAFKEDRDQVVQRSFQQGIGTTLCPTDVTEPNELPISLDLKEKYENIIIAAGVHPHNAKSFEPSSAQKIIELAKALPEIKNVSLEELKRETSENFKSLFMFEIKNL